MHFFEVALKQPFHYFAVAVYRWHYPTAGGLNAEQTLAKYMTRFDLGFSDVTRTVTVKQRDIRVVPDLMRYNRTSKWDTSAFEMCVLFVILWVTCTSRTGF